MVVATQTEQVQELIGRLASLGPAAGFPVLSLYLDARPGQNGKHSFGAFVRKELAARRALVDPADLVSYDRDVARIQEWLAGELDPAASGVAVFASDGRGLFEAVQLEAPIEENRLHVDRQPHLYTLARVLDLFPRYAALVTDTHLARIFVFDLGARRRQATVENEKMRRTDTGGWSQMRYQRHVDEHRQQHLREVVEALDHIVRADAVERVVLSGDEPALSRLRDELPKPLLARLVDVVKMDARAPEHEVLQASLEALRRHEARTDVERVQRLLDDWRAGGLAVAGRRETEAALALGEAHEVLISADPMAVRDASSPQPDRDAQVALCERLVGMAQATDARVHFVEDSALLAGVGGVAAALRFRTEAQSGDARQA